MGVSGSGVSLPPVRSKGGNTFNTSAGLPQRAADVAGPYAYQHFSST